MKENEKTEILLEALNIYGLSNQLLVLSEECSEVIKEMKRLSNDPQIKSTCKIKEDIMNFFQNYYE